jgi:hypothetical protein
MSHRGNRLYEFGEFQLDASARCLSRRGVTVPLTPKAIDLLLALVEEPGNLLNKDALLKKVWPDSFVEENNLADTFSSCAAYSAMLRMGPRLLKRSRNAATDSSPKCAASDRTRVARPESNAPPRTPDGPCAFPGCLPAR